MSTLDKNQTNRLLGYPADARLLILNADDFGMCHSVNEAIKSTLQEGLIRSTSLMVPCPQALHAMYFLKDYPEIPFGIHLTILSDSINNRWRPFTALEKVPSLVDHAGFFYDFEGMHVLRDQGKLEEMEIEFKAQIESVLAFGLKPTHLDWHSLRFGNRTDIHDLMVQLAKEYKLAIRVIGQAAIEKLQKQGFPTLDNDFLDSYSMDPRNKPALYTQYLRELPAGLSEWAIHPGLDTAEFLALEPANNHERQTDFDFWTSQLAKDIVREEGINLLDYRTLQNVWIEKLSSSDKY